MLVAPAAAVLGESVLATVLGVVAVDEEGLVVFKGDFWDASEVLLGESILA